MAVSTNLLTIATLLLVSITKATVAIDRPNFTGTARVKQHFHKSGELIAGEEHLLKVIVKWVPIPTAVQYELCHMCNHIDEETGEADDSKMNTEAKIYQIDPSSTCGGQPCQIMPGTEKGHNKFHLRVKGSDGEWSVWSKHQNFLVAEPGTEMHVNHPEL